MKPKTEHRFFRNFRQTENIADISVICREAEWKKLYQLIIKRLIKNSKNLRKKIQYNRIMETFIKFKASKSTIKKFKGRPEK